MTHLVERQNHLNTSMRRDFDRVATAIFLFGMVFGGLLMVLLLAGLGHLA